MCGIFGWNLKPGADKAPMRTVGAVLAMLNDHRGGHSWGVHADGKTTKGLGDIGKACVKLAPRFANADVLIGHTRYATTGATTKANAHPFSIGGLVGAHNGIVYNHAELNARYGRSCAVDSMHLFHHLADSLPMHEIEAYGAMEWIDREEPAAVNLACFNGGDIAIAKTPMGVIWSSDHEHLDAAMGWASIEYQDYEIREGQVYSAHHGDLYQLASIDIGIRKASNWPVKWDDAKRSAGVVDRLPSQADIDFAWEEAGTTAEEWEEWEAEQDRIYEEERELTRDFDAAMNRDSRFS